MGLNNNDNNNDDDHDNDNEDDDDHDNDNNNDNTTTTTTTTTTTISFLRECDLVSCYSYPKGRVKIFSFCSTHTQLPSPRTSGIYILERRGGAYPLFITVIHKT